MRTRCESVRGRIVALRAGWLPRRSAAAVKAHLADCYACARIAEADSRIAATIEGLHDRDVPIPSWTQVLDAHAEVPRPRRPLLWEWHRAPALALAGSATVLALAAYLGRPPQVGVPEIAAGESVARTAQRAHFMMTAVDVSGDPNRAVIALYTEETGRTATP